MKYIVLVGMLAVLLLACTPQNEHVDMPSSDAHPEDSTPAPMDEHEESVAVEEHQPEPEVVSLPPEPIASDTTVQEVNPTETHDEQIIETAQPRTKLYKFLDAFAQNVNSYSFIYGSDRYYSKGTRYKIILANPRTARDVTTGDGKHFLTFYYDTIYLDRAGKQAAAYCEGHKSSTNQQCESLELRDIPLPVSYDEFSIRLPEDWLLEYVDYEPSLFDRNKNYIKGRITTFARVENGTHDIDLNFDERLGLPLRVDIKIGNVLIKRYDYEDVVSNKVRDVDVTHRRLDEIPPEEAFYP